MRKSRSQPAHLSTAKDFERALKALAHQCEYMRDAAERLGPPPPRDFQGDFAGLARIVVGQQVSAASAAAIWKRVHAGIVPFAPVTILATDDAPLQALGLSRPKIKTLRAISHATVDGHIDFARLAESEDCVVRETLTAVSGIGPWSADIFLLFALRRADAFPSGDLALQLATQHLMRLERRPQAAELDQIAERWRPWRGAAAHLLWALYADLKWAAKSAP